MPFANLTDVRCYYDQQGEGDPVVLIPGLGSTSLVWDPIRAQMAKRFTLLSIENRGIGRSVPKRQPSTVRDYSADLVELLDYLQVDQAHIVGLSLGGIIAQCFAVEHPSRVRRLVLISSAHRFGPYLREMARLVAQTMRLFPKPMFARTMEVLTAGPQYLDECPDRIEERVRQVREMGVSGRAMIRQLRVLGASRFEAQEYHIPAPTLVIAGEFDRLIPHCYGQRMAQLIEHSQFVLLPNAGHNPVNECPEKVLELVLEFLQGGEIASVEAPIRRRRHVA